MPTRTLRRPQGLAVLQAMPCGAVRHRWRRRAGSRLLENERVLWPVQPRHVCRGRRWSLQNVPRRPASARARCIGLPTVPCRPLRRRAQGAALQAQGAGSYTSLCGVPVGQVEQLPGRRREVQALRRGAAWCGRCQQLCVWWTVCRWAPQQRGGIRMLAVCHRAIPVQAGADDVPFLQAWPVVSKGGLGQVQKLSRGALHGRNSVATLRCLPSRALWQTWRGTRGVRGSLRSGQVFRSGRF